VTYVTDGDYTVTADDCYIGVMAADAVITLPPGVTGKMYYIKNITTGKIRVECTPPNTIDSGAPPTLTLGTNNFVAFIFSFNRWNIISA
jgi:hypothetical protein